MNQPFRLPDPANDEPSRQEDPSGDPLLRFAPEKFDSDDNDEIKQVARTLAEHGGGAVAFDLALDLVLNEIVEQARSTTGATGAAIALMRDGEMVCRATTGTNAPDLGVRVEMDSGLSGECLKTGEIQQCNDTENDPRVNADACRHLGVRSMLIAPISDGQQCFGILEALSSEPNAFGEKDFYVLRGLARRAVQDKKEADEGTLNPTQARESAQEDPAGGEKPEQTATAEEISRAPATPTKNEMLTSVLVVLLIAVAVLLGVVIGWRRAALGLRASTESTVTTNDRPVNQEPSAIVSANSQPPSQNVPANAPATSLEKQKARPAKNSVPAGGLIVTENGNVIYKIEPANAARAGTGGRQSSANRIVRKVEPEYPPQARAQGIQGPVVLDVRIGSDGRVGNVDVVSGDPVLAGAAVSAVKQWVYAPFSPDGKAVDRQTRITFRFTLSPG